MARLLSFILVLLVFGMHSADARRGVEPAFATGAEDPVLYSTLMSLGPRVDPEEARRVAFTAYTTGRELKKEWRVVWPPGYQNYLVHTGRRKGGLCFQFATELLLRLDALKLKTLQLHWAESFPGTMSEHNVIVVTVPGQPFNEGVLLDNWRYGGRLVWGKVTADPHYNWAENSAEMIHRLRTRTIAAHGHETTQ
ncbi:MAG: hypothetical protein M3032_13335 [Verrucomicrobiota bacterium]|nr:hypothetical protein [Verrucomicrobiota bacterium]